MENTDLNELVEHIKHDMRNAMKDRDLMKLDELRSLLARISNAETVLVGSNMQDMQGRIAGASNGVGSTEVERKQLTFTEIQMIVADEIHELEDALMRVDTKSEYATTLRKKLTIVRKYCFKKPNSLV